MDCFGGCMVEKQTKMGIRPMAGVGNITSLLRFFTGLSLDGWQNVPAKSTRRLTPRLCCRIYEKDHLGYEYYLVCENVFHS
jgi:hypothetical protein